MNALNPIETISCLLGLTLISPLISCITRQLPRKMLAEYKSECLEFLEQKKITPQKVRLLSIKESRYKTEKKLNLLFFMPILSYVLAKTKLKTSEAKNAELILLIETLTISIGIITFMELGLTYFAICQLTFYLSLIIIAFIDAETKLIPDIISLTVLWLGLVFSAFQLIPVSPEVAIIGASLGYTLPWLISKIVCYRAQKPDGMGYGDFKMLAMLGAWLGPLNLLNITIFASVIFLLYFSLMKMAGQVNKNSLIPFAPFLSIATWVVCQNQIFHFSEHLRIIMN